jgi:AcrR family transcriptional regulator
MRKGAATRKAILDEALALSSRIGFEALSIGDLALAVGLSKSGLYAHFRGKEALQVEVLRTAADLFREMVALPAAEAPTGEARLRALFDRWIAWSQSDRLPGGCIFISASSEYEDRPGPVRDYLAAAQRRWLDHLARAAEEAVSCGDFRADVDPAQFAHDFYAVILAYKHFGRLLDDPAAESKARAGFERLLTDSRPAS